MISSKAWHANAIRSSLKRLSRQQPLWGIQVHSFAQQSLLHQFSTTKYNDSDDDYFRPPESSLFYNPATFKGTGSTSAIDALDETRFPVGTLTVEQFLAFEDELSDLCYQNQNSPSKPDIQQSFLLLSRLVNEHEANPDLLDHYDMAHWLYGNYPRCTKLLHECLFNWMKWREDNAHEQELNLDSVEAFIDQLRSGNMSFLVTDQTYRYLMDAANEEGPKDQAALLADRLIDQMLEESLENPQMRPTFPTLQSALRAWSESGLSQATQKADVLFNTMCELYEDGISDHAPVNSTYIAMMKAWKDSPQKIESILNMMKISPFPGVAPSEAAYRLAIHAWLSCREPKSTGKAYSLFVDLIQAYMSTRDKKIMIDTDFFSAMISALAKEGECDKAEDTFLLLQELYRETQDRRFEPSTKALLGMIIAYSKSGNVDAARKAESILLELEKRSLTHQNDEDLPPKRGYYSDVLHALVREPQKEGLKCAEELLKRMVNHHRAGWVNILPDKALFDQVIDGWSRTNSKEGPLRAERLLQSMQRIAIDLQRSDTRPDEKTYFHAITAWARSRDPVAPDRAEKLFFGMLELYNKGDTKMKPSMIHYTTLINCWARSKHPDGPVRAQQAFNTVIAHYESGDKDFEPDSMLYYALMKSFSQKGDAITVESIFLQQFELYASSKRKNIMPSTRSFNVLLEAWLKSGHPDAQKKATLIYDSMVEFTEEQTLYVPPDALTFSTVIDIMVQNRSIREAEKYLEVMQLARQKAGRRNKDIWVHQERQAMKMIDSLKKGK